MKAQAVEPTGNFGWIETQLDKAYIDFLWMILKEGKEKGDTHKNKLAGNISNSFSIDDKQSYFFKNVLKHHIKGYAAEYGMHPFTSQTNNEKITFNLMNFWGNYQYKHEFNPSHRHGGIYSFVIWLKIPYHWEEQNKLPHLKGIKEIDKKPGLFEFEYINILGNIKNFAYMLNSDYEGTMLFFPAALRHCVYPFYNTDEPRISISGNIGLIST
tara:strand:- start:414 stop:1052 length:639 start_codon:yes stop_codon:yes gene_type:complete